MLSSVRWEKRRWQVDGGGTERWLIEREWDTAAPLTSLAETGLVCDEVQGADVTLRRIWHTPVILSRTPPTESRAFDDILTVVLLVDGEMTVEVAGRERDLRSNDVLVWMGDQLQGLHASSAVARIELTMSRPAGVPPLAPTVFSAKNSSMAPGTLTFLANVILNAEGSPRAAVAEPLRVMLVSAVELLVAENARPTFQARSPDQLFADALAHIASYAHIPTTSATSVSQAMHVSRQYLTRVFTARETSIGVEIRRHRVRSAERLLSAGWMTPHEAAASAGFSSLRAMRRAIRESH